MTLRKLTHARLGSHDVADAYVTSNAQAFGKPPGAAGGRASAGPMALAHWRDVALVDGRCKGATLALA